VLKNAVLVVGYHVDGSWLGGRGCGGLWDHAEKLDWGHGHLTNRLVETASGAASEGGGEDVIDDDRAAGGQRREETSLDFLGDALYFNGLAVLKKNVTRFDGTNRGGGTISQEDTMLRRGAERGIITKRHGMEEGGRGGALVQEASHSLKTACGSDEVTDLQLVHGGSGDDAITLNSDDGISSETRTAATGTSRKIGVFLVVSLVVEFAFELLVSIQQPSVLLFELVILGFTFLRNCIASRVWRIIGARLPLKFCQGSL